MAIWSSGGGVKLTVVSIDEAAWALCHRPSRSPEFEVGWLSTQTSPL